MDGQADLGTRILTFNDADYRYGVGVLRFQVISVQGVAFREDGHDWVQAWGLVVGWNGATQGMRTVYVRADKWAAAVAGSGGQRRR